MAAALLAEYLGGLSHDLWASVVRRGRPAPLVTAPLSFAAGILVSLLTARRRPETPVEALSYAAWARRMHLGAAEE
jgi:hypothetical protein